MVSLQAKNGPWCSKENMMNIAKKLLILFIIIIFFLFIWASIKRHRYMCKYEPLLCKNYLDLTNNISSDNSADNFSYSIEPSKTNIAFSLSFWIFSIYTPDPHPWDTPHKGKLGD